jgi:NTP pyrophosphatase (non-canonical NTP hydrolase)
MTDEEAKRAIEKAKANRFDEYGNYGENNGPVGETKEEPRMEIDEYGSKYWYLNGKLHREDGPAIEGAGGAKSWYLNDKLHREDGPAVEWADGYKEWYLNGKLHREDGPAVEYTDGTKEWCLKDKLHREDGPAIEWADGYKEWYLNDEEVTEEEHKKRTSDKPEEVNYAEFVESMVITYGRDRLAENTLGLVGEAGEVAEKVKKYFRDGTFDEAAIQKELGDVIFYWYAMHGALKLDPEETIKMNMEKLSSRKERGVIRGSGDYR